MTVQVGKYGRIILPKQLRQKYGLNEGNQIIIIDHMGHICLIPIKTHEKPTKALYGSVKPQTPIDDPKHVAREHMRKKLTEDFQ